MLGLVGKLLLPRVERWPWLGLGWPESTAASSAAAAGVRSCTGTGLELEGERSEALGMLYGVLRTRWTRRGDQMVTGAASTASSATAEVRSWWGGGYGEGTRGRRGGNGGVAHRGCSGRRSGLGDALETANSSATVVGARRGERRRGGDAGLPGTRGAVGEEEGVEAELLSYSGERGVAGVSGYGERRRRWCSAESERERGRNGGE